MLLHAASNNVQDVAFEPTAVTNKSRSLNLPKSARGPKFMKVKGKGGGFMKLTSIDEDDLDFSMDGSAAATGNVSSDGGDGMVGDLDDFDEVDPQVGLVPIEMQET